MDNTLIEQRCNNGHQHTNRGRTITFTRCIGRPKHFKAENEEACSNDVTQLNDQFEIHVLALLLLEEAKHAVRHHVTADNVDTC